MNNNEHLALFILGVATLGITFLLLYALSDRNTSSIPLVEKQTQVQSVQAAITPRTEPVPPPSMEALHREVAETFAKTAEYLGRGKYNETEHIELLERLKFYSSISSIRPEQKKAAQDFINDMDRLLSLKESVARQVKLAEQINAAVTDAQVHLASGERNKAEANKLMDRIEGLYAISGLSDTQNEQLRTSLAALKKAYKTSEKRIVSSTTKSSTKADMPKAYTPNKVQKKPAPVVKSAVKPETESNPIRKAIADKAVTKKVEPATKPVAKLATKPDPEVVTRKFQSVMKYVARYFVEKKYVKWQHDNLTRDLKEIEKNADLLSSVDQKRLSQTIEKMNWIDEKYGSNASDN